MAFPTSGLVDNQVHKEGNRSYVYDSTLTVWNQLRDAPDTISILGGGKSLDDVALGSGVVFPSGHIVKHSVVRHRHPSGSSVTFTIPFSGSEALVDFGSGKTLQLTGVTATEGNLLLISTGGFNWYVDVDATYATNLNVRIDGTIGAGWGASWMNNPYTMTPVYFQTYYTVPAGFTDKTIEFYAWKQTSNPATSNKFYLASAYGDVEAFVSVLEIQA